MTEEQFEILEKAFPKGFLCISIMKNDTLHFAYANCVQSPTLEELRKFNTQLLKELERKQNGPY